MPTENRSSNTEIRKIVTESLVGMIAGVTRTVPPVDAPLPDFIQGPVDRAVERIASLLTPPVDAAYAPSEPSGARMEMSDEWTQEVFSKRMLRKLKASAAKGRTGWQQCSHADLSRMLREHVEKGDPVDVANFCMFLDALGFGIAPAAQHQGDPIVVEAVAVTREDNEGLRLEWLLEGGIAALEFPGQVLLVAHGSVTDDTGSGKVYLHPPTSDGYTAEQMTIQGADGYRNGIKAAAELAADYPELAQAIRELPLPQ